MSDTSTHLGLPYLLAAQAQKHVTHNEALRLLDAMVQLSVLDRTRTAPPASPTGGNRHLVASGGTGLWAGWDLNVAFWVDGVWLRLVPRQGWLVWIAAEQAFVVWNGSGWDPVGVPQDVSDAIFSLVNGSDPTKKALFSLSGITTGTTRTLPQPTILPRLAAAPSPPSSGKIAVYARNRAGAPWIDVMRPSGRDFPLQPHFGVNRIANWSPSVTTTITTEALPITSVGTVSTPALAATNLTASMRRWRLTPAALVDSVADQRSAGRACWRGKGRSLPFPLSLREWWSCFPVSRRIRRPHRLAGIFACSKA